MYICMHVCKSIYAHTYIFKPAHVFIIQKRFWGGSLIDWLIDWCAMNVLRRAIKETIPNAFPRVQLDLSASVFASTLNAALGQNLSEPFNPYANSLNWLLAIYLVPYVGLTGYVGAIPRISSRTAKRVRLFFVIIQYCLWWWMVTLLFCDDDCITSIEGSFH